MMAAGLASSAMSSAAGFLSKAHRIETNTDTGVAGFAQLVTHRRFVRVARTENAKSAGVGHRRGEFAARGQAHWCQQNRVLNVQQARERGRNCRHAVPPEGSFLLVPYHAARAVDQRVASQLQ